MMTDAELLEFTQEFRDGILDGGPSDMRCFMVCAPLVTLLNMSGVPAKLEEAKSVRTVYGECNHVWIKLSDGRVLDPTADQFNSRRRKMPPIYLGKPTSLHRHTPPTKEEGR